MDAPDSKSLPENAYEMFGAGERSGRNRRLAFSGLEAT